MHEMFTDFTNKKKLELEQEKEQLSSNYTNEIAQAEAQLQKFNIDCAALQQEIYKVQGHYAEVLKENNRPIVQSVVHQSVFDQECYEVGQKQKTINEKIEAHTNEISALKDEFKKVQQEQLDIDEKIKKKQVEIDYSFPLFVEETRANLNNEIDHQHHNYYAFEDSIKAERLRLTKEIEKSQGLAKEAQIDIQQVVDEQKKRFQMTSKQLQLDQSLKDKNDIERIEVSFKEKKIILEAQIQEINEKHEARMKEIASKFEADCDVLKQKFEEELSSLNVEEQSLLIQNAQLAAALKQGCFDCPNKRKNLEFLEFRFNNLQDIINKAVAKASITEKIIEKKIFQKETLIAFPNLSRSPSSNPSGVVSARTTTPVRPAKAPTHPCTSASGFSDLNSSNLPKTSRTRIKK